MHVKALWIARRVRKACEKVARDAGANEVERQIYDFAGEDSLACMCAIASSALVKALRDEGIKASLVSGIYDSMGYVGREDDWENHAWVELDDGTIIDITATQFGVKKKVLVGTYDTLEQFIRRRRHRAAVPRKLWNYPSQDPNQRIVKRILALV